MMYNNYYLQDGYHDHVVRVNANAVVCRGDGQSKAVGMPTNGPN